MRTNKKKTTLFGGMLLVTLAVMSSCKSIKYVEATGVAYQSIKSATPVTEVPDNAKIIVYCNVDAKGTIDVTVKNNTDKVMTIDRGMTYFQDGENNSIPYYNPTIVVNTQSTTVGETNGANVNLGSVASAVGIGGAVGKALNGINVGGASGSSTTNTSTTYIIDQERIRIAPHNTASLGRSFSITGIGQSFLSRTVQSAYQDVNNVFTHKQSYASCNICVSYSFDDGQSFETITTDIYADVLVVNKVWNKGKVNEALRKLYATKPDAIYEPWFLLHFESNSNHHNRYFTNSPIINYK